MRPVIALALLAGCDDGVRVDDSFSSSIDLEHFGEGENRISSPYLRGASFQYSIVGDADEIADMTLASDDDSVLLVGPTTTGPEDAERFAPVQAVGSGTAMVTVTDSDGKRRERFEVRVGDADRLTLHPVARLVRQDESEDETPTFLVPARAEIEIHPFDGPDLLTGSTRLAPASPGGLSVGVSEYHASGLHDVLVVLPSEVGTYTLAMPYAGGPVNFTVDAVDYTDVAAIGVECQPTEDLDDGDTQYCQSTAALSDGTDVYGVNMAWSVGGTTLENTGDLLLVIYVSGRAQTAVATFGDLTATATMTGNPWRVSSTNDVVARSSVGGVSP